MHTKTSNRIKAAAVSAVVLASALIAPFGFSPLNNIEIPSNTITANAAGDITIDDLPSDYEYAAEWIWQNRIVRENSTGRWNTIFDQIIAGKGTINYVVKWQSYKDVTLEQRQKFETLVSDSINAWNDWLAGYENWPYDHIDVNIVGWAVIDENNILDPQPDEIIYTDTKYYDAQYDTSNGYETIPDKEPYAPDELSRFYHFENRLNPTFDAYNYPGGLDKRFDMYLWATEGFPSIGGCGGDWGQRLSDTAYLNMLDGANIHVLEHEIGHGFGITDFYGGEGAIDGFPPGGFPGGGTSIMMAGSSAVITDFDGWLLRYMWTQIKDEEGRFDIEETPVVTTTTTSTTTTTTTTTTQPSVTTTTTTADPNAERIPTEFTPTEANTKWTFNANGAEAVELTFTGDAYGGGHGVLGYWDGAWNEIYWEGRIDENGKMVVIVPLVEGLGEVQIQKNYAGIWDNDLSDMKDITIDLESVVLLYGSEATTTTTTTTTVPSEGDVEAEATLSDEGYWVFNANGADSADIYLSAPPAAGANGALGYYDGAWLQPGWEGTFDGNGELILTVDFNSEVGDVQVHKYWAQAWDNALGAMADCDVTVAKVILHYGDEETETTTTTTTTTSDSESTTTTTTTSETTTTTISETTTTTVSTTTSQQEETSTTTTTTTQTPGNILVGDANNNGEVEVADAVYILQGIADPGNDKFIIPDENKPLADADGSGSVDVQDALVIQQYKADIVTTLPPQ